MKKRLCTLLLLAALIVSLLCVPAGAKLGDAYGYDETPADKVTITVTISNDGVPLVGTDADQTVLAHLDVTVPYFDLALYRLEKYYRYPAHTVTTDDGTDVIYDTSAGVIQRPTALHAVIWLLERYYYGLPESQCGKGAAKAKNFANSGKAMTDLKANKYANEYDALLLAEQGAMSLYMSNFWGHDMNLLYFRNHTFPLMYEGFGSTLDYQLLSDGNTLDFSMHSDEQFYQDGAFACFGQDTYEVEAGQTLRVRMLYKPSYAVEGEGSDDYKPATALTAAVYDDEWYEATDAALTPEAGGDGWYTVTFPQAGTYYLMGHDPNWGKPAAHTAPAVAKVVVTAAQESGLANTTVQRSGGNVRLQCVLDAPGGQLLAATYREGRLASAAVRNVTSAGAQVLTLPADGDTVKLFFISSDGAASETAFTGKLGG